MKKLQLRACQDLIKRIDSVLNRGGGSSLKSGYYKGDIFCDGGTFIARIPGLTGYAEKENIGIKEPYKEILQILKREEGEIKEYNNIIKIKEEEFRKFGRREKYAKIACSKIAVSLYVLRRIKILAEGDYILLFNGTEGSCNNLIKFESEIGVEGYFTPLKYLEDTFPEIGEKRF